MNSVLHERKSLPRCPWQHQERRNQVFEGHLATLLDPNGYAVRDVPVSRQGDALTVTLPPETMYLVLQRSAQGSL